MAYEFDAAIVLGCGINKDGTLSDDSKESTGIATELYELQRTPLIIFSGDISYKAGFVPPHGESAAMQAFAQELGLPPDPLLQENESKDTLGNAYFTKVRYLIPRHLQHLAVVPGPDHSLERLQYIFGKILGSQYTVTFFEHNANRTQEAEREKRSLNILKEWFDSIPAGDHEAIYRVMLDKHPGYRP
jgi:uncharacterized SAM-binding protein YcdF (DUF218 family)